MGLFAIKGLQEQQDQIKALTTRIEALEQNGTVGDGSVAGVDSTGLIASLESALVKIKELVVEKFTAKTATIGKLEMIDQITGEKYCTWIENGEWKKQKGACDAPIIPADTGGGPTPTATETPAEVLGCINSQATNYNASANKDDGSCVMSEVAPASGEATPASVPDSGEVSPAPVEEPVPANSEVAPTPVEDPAPIVEEPVVEVPPVEEPPPVEAPVILEDPSIQ
jgi:hypothetical protein